MVGGGGWKGERTVEGGGKQDGGPFWRKTAGWSGRPGREQGGVGAILQYRAPGSTRKGRWRPE